jgi:hypothetical protein
VVASPTPNFPTPSCISPATKIRLKSKVAKTKKAQRGSQLLADYDGEGLKNLVTLWFADIAEIVESTKGFELHMILKTHDPNEPWQPTPGKRWKRDYFGGPLGTNL